VGNSYERHGDGEHKVLVLHGWFGDASAWRSWTDHLDGDRFSYAFMDYRGYGDSRHAAGDYSMAEISADAITLADELGWEKFSVLGHSMGGMAAQRVLVDVPDRVRKVVGVSPVPASGVPFDDEGWALFSGAAKEPDNRRAIIDLTTGNRLCGTWLDRMVQHSMDRSVPEAVSGYLEAWARTDFHEQVSGNDTPVLVIVGEHDPALGAPVMEQTFGQWYPNVELEVFPNAGHYAMEETPVALATSVERFLDA